MLPPDLKYIITTIIAENMQARLNDRAVLFVGEILINDVLKSKNNNIILIICSINSVMLIAKNFFCPHSAPRKTSYIDENISAGKSKYIISVDAVEVNTILRAFGNIMNISETIIQIAPVVIKPDETIDPIDFLSFLLE